MAPDRGQDGTDEPGDLLSPFELDDPETSRKRAIDPVRVARVRLARKVTQGFVRACRSYRLYTERHELRHRFVADLYAGLTDFLAGERWMLLEVTPERIFWDGEVVHEETQEAHGLPFLLYRDGVRLLRFSAGVPEDQVHQLVEVLSGHIEAMGGSEEDVGAQLWEAHLTHIEVSVASTFLDADEAERRVLEELEDEIGALVGAMEDAAAPAAVPVLPPTATPPAGSAVGGTDGARGPEAAFPPPTWSPEGAEIPLPEVAPEDRLSLRPAGAPLSRVDLARLRERVQEASSGAIPLDEAGAVLQQVAASLPSPGELKPFLEDFRAALLPFLMAGGVGEFVALARPLHLWAATLADGPDRRLRLVRSLFASLADPKVLALLVPHLGPGFLEQEKGDLFVFALLQPAGADTTLFWLLERTHAYEARRALSDALLIRSGFDAEVFKHRVTEGSWRLVSDVVYCLGRIGSPEAVQYLLAAFQRDDPTVRREVLVALRPFRTSRVDEMARRALKDPAEKVRLEALRHIVVHRLRDAVPDVRQAIAARSYARLGAAERRALALAWGHLERDAAASWFARELGRWSQDEPSESEEEDALVAVAVLAQAGNDEARAALQRATQRPPGRLRDACRDALSRS